jgi:hypothetical protein
MQKTVGFCIARQFPIFTWKVLFVTFCDCLCEGWKQLYNYGNNILLHHWLPSFEISKGTLCNMKVLILVMWYLGLDMLVSKKNQVNNFMNNILGIKWGSIKHVITFGTCFKCASFFFLFGV